MTAQEAGRGADQGVPHQRGSGRLMGGEDGTLPVVLADFIPEPMQVSPAGKVQKLQVIRMGEDRPTDVHRLTARQRFHKNRTRVGAWLMMARGKDPDAPEETVQIDSVAYHTPSMHIFKTVHRITSTNSNFDPVRVETFSGIGKLAKQQHERESNKAMRASLGEAATVTVAAVDTAVMVLGQPTIKEAAVAALATAATVFLHRRGRRAASRAQTLLRVQGFTEPITKLLGPTGRPDYMDVKLPIV